MNNKFAIIGSGALGTSLAKVLSNSGNEITIFGIDKQELNELSNGKNTKYFPETVSLPSFKTTDSIEEALKGANYIIIAVPSFALNMVLPQIIEFHSKDALIIMGSKGFYPDTNLSLHEGVQEKIKGIKSLRGVVSLIGPSHAEEIVLEMPTTVAAVDTNEELCKEVQELFLTNYFKVYVQTDVKGAEVGAAYKNVLAISSGMAEGLGFGINTIAALLTRGMAEMRRYNKVMGGKDETLMGLTGFGDIIVTATSNLSRNFTFGKMIAKEGKKALETKTTVEGLYALKSIYKIANEKDLDLPIIKFLYSVLFGDNKPENFIDTIWNRGLKSE